MVKQKAVVDSCFLQKISAQGKYPDNIKRILDNFGYIPVAHKYVAEQELLLHGYLKKLIEEGYITTIEYDEYLKDDFARQIYERQFIDLYNEMRNYLQCSGGRKQMPMLNIPSDCSLSDEFFLNWPLAGNNVAPHIFDRNPRKRAKKRLLSLSQTNWSPRPTTQSRPKSCCRALS